MSATGNGNDLPPRLVRDREAERTVLRRSKHCSPLADTRKTTLGNLLDCMVYAEGVDDREPFERRALSMLSDLFDMISYCDEVPEGLPYSIHRLTAVMVEIGRRLEEAGPIIETRGDDDEPEPDDGSAPPLSPTEISQLTSALSSKGRHR